MTRRLCASLGKRIAVRYYDFQRPCTGRSACYRHFLYGRCCKHLATLCPPHCCHARHEFDARPEFSLNTNTSTDFAFAVSPQPLVPIVSYAIICPEQRSTTAWYFLDIRIRPCDHHLAHPPPADNDSPPCQKESERTEPPHPLYSAPQSISSGGLYVRGRSLRSANEKKGALIALADPRSSQSFHTGRAVERAQPSLIATTCKAEMTSGMLIIEGRVAAYPIAPLRRSYLPSHAKQPIRVVGKRLPMPAVYRSATHFPSRGDREQI